MSNSMQSSSLCFNQDITDVSPYIYSNTIEILKLQYGISLISMIVNQRHNNCLETEDCSIIWELNNHHTFMWLNVNHFYRCHKSDTFHSICPGCASSRFLVIFHS